MLAHVLWAFKNSATTPQITVLDLCETPLFLCKWYGKTLGVRIETTASDIFTYESRPFDIIVTDAFLTRFSSDARREVVQKWRRLLSPKGTVVTTVRVECGLSKSSIQATPDQADSFRRRALQEARRWQGFLSCPPNRIANLAQRYAERMTSYSLSSEDEVRSLFHDAGFNVKTLILTEVPGEMASTQYAEVVACRD
ncbi:MAG: class I SAM-dependent methyltransferase [Acidobacteriaceae bacterium]